MIVLESKPEAVSKLDTVVREMVRQHQLDDSLHADILITLTEAVNNAIIHGNKKDGRKSVTIQIEKRSDGLHIFVEDQGCGFDPECLKDPTDPANLDQCGGRGVFLIKELCHSVHFHNNGATVEMCFEI
ncbi:MAG: ATP-binding protein [Saprospirales bacterium]|nr:MAG: ATP-binding protein [Saprospirales bacterium]